MYWCLTDGLADAKTAGVEDVGVHTLRHSATVGWLEAGMHIKAVADMLGHSPISITGEIYGHTSGDTARAAVDGWSGVLGCRRQNRTRAYP
jgi:site-specific recombinase XerD